ncbi:MAG: putative amidohydrolase, partial [Ilumatobacteraceae bacterium]|nr:putative amidohydrolase [Ilumatobacteraceae bacterium]
QPWGTLGGNTIQTGREKVPGIVTVQPFDRIDPSASDVGARLSLLDEMGIYAQILYPNGIGFASNQIFAIPDEQQRITVLRIYNDFLADVQEESNKRLFPQAILPIWDMNETVKEMTRLIDRGINGFTLSDKPELLGLPELPEKYFEPMWDLFNESGTVPNFHIGSGLRNDEVMGIIKRLTSEKTETKRELRTSALPSWEWFDWQRNMAVMGTQMFISNVRIIVNLCFSNMFDRYPNLKIVSAESGVGWLPFLLEAMDFQFSEIVTRPHELALAKRKPSEYFHDHIFAMFWFERLTQQMVDAIGVNNIMVETDIPHPTCYYPGARQHFADVLGDLAPADRRRIAQDNAAELYGIPLPTID